VLSLVLSPPAIAESSPAGIVSIVTSTNPIAVRRNRLSHGSRSGAAARGGADVIASFVMWFRSIRG
jgi:hypothetical protein